MTADRFAGTEQLTLVEPCRLSRDELLNRGWQNAPGWVCWRCGWWKTDMGFGSSRPTECGECATWSRERHLPLDTIVPATVTVVPR